MKILLKTIKFGDIRRGKIYKQYFPDILREYLGCNYKSKRTYILT